MRFPQRRQPTTDEVIRDAAARNGARDLATAFVLLIFAVIAIDTQPEPKPAAQPVEEEESNFVDYLKQLAEVVL